MAHPNSQFDRLPPLWRDPSYHGMNLTQFLGAFNDNLFKQLVLLLCVDYARETGKNYQSLALFLFALPFVAFSGFAGYLADRISKRQIVVAMKVAEIGVMSAGFLAFHSTFARLAWLLAVVFLMGTHSAFFGPSKYGILPEMFRESDLPQVNGMIQMTTFLSIIFGMALAGFTKEWFGDRLWIGSAMCIGIAVAGTATSLLVRRTPVAHPGLPFTPSALFISSETWRMIRGDRPLLAVLLVSSLFWFLGGVIQPLVNDYGKLQLGFGDGRTSIMAVCMAIGIMVGCIGAGKASTGKIRFGFVTMGAWGIVVCLAAAAFLSAGRGAVATQAALDTGVQEPAGQASMTAGVDNRYEPRAAESFVEILVPKSRFEWVIRAFLTGVGLFAGFFYVPLAVFMQVRPPLDQKGRMIGAMNLANWIGILIAAVFFLATRFACAKLEVRESWIFGVAAAVMLPIALFYRPRVNAAGPPPERDAGPPLAGNAASS